MKIHLSKPNNETVHSFILKKCQELHPTPPEIVSRWMMTILVTWAGKSIWGEISTNKRKMTMVYNYWVKHFFGFGLENSPNTKILKQFRTMIRKELKQMKSNAQKARDKYEQKDKPIKENPDVVDYFSQEFAKLANSRTVNKIIAPHRMVKVPQLTVKHPPPKPLRKPVKNPYATKKTGKSSPRSAPRPVPSRQQQVSIETEIVPNYTASNPYASDKRVYKSVHLQPR